MAREPLPPKGPIPERVREPLAGPSRNAEQLAAILERDRALFVKRHREGGSGRIDSDGDPWYGDGSVWTDERIKAALDKSVFEGLARQRPKAVVVPADVVVKVGKPSMVDKPNTLTAKKPWEDEGISRRTWYNRREKPGGG